MAVKVKRIYDEYESDDGYRILVDGLWPRGIKKEDARLDEWNKELAPSKELRKWFDHQPERFAEFEKRFRKELLPAKQNEIDRLIKLSGKNKVTLLFGARDTEHNHALVIYKIITGDKSGQK